MWRYCTEKLAWQARAGTASAVFRKRTCRATLAAAAPKCKTPELLTACDVFGLPVRFVDGPLSVSCGKVTVELFPRSCVVQVWQAEMTLKPEKRERERERERERKQASKQASKQERKKERKKERQKGRKERKNRQKERKKEGRKEGKKEKRGNKEIKE